MNFRTAQFDRAATRYDRLSSVQRQMARRLLELAEPAIDPESLLELGCGTGHLTRLLLERWPSRRVVVSDSSAAMLERCRAALAGTHPACTWQRLDAARYDADWLNAESEFDLVASNALIQWLPDLGAHLDAVRHALRPSGCYLVSSFSTEHFPELRAIVERPPFEFPGLPGVDLSEFARVAEKCNLRLTASGSEELPVVYSSSLALLRSLRDMGASRYPGVPRLTPSLLRALTDTYTARHAVPDGVVCTWRPWYALLTLGAQSET